MGIFVHWVVSEPTSLREFLQKVFHGVTSPTLKQWMQHGRIWINGQLTKQLATELKSGDIVERREGENLLLGRIKIVAQGPDFIILDKPRELLSVDTELGGKDNLFSLVKEAFAPQHVYVVHRLDRETSGLICFALTPEGFESLKNQIMDRQMHRRYIAVVHGSPEEDEGVWDLWLDDSSGIDVRVCQEGKGEQAVTFYSVLERRGNLTLLDLELVTGKKHQIRVSCAEAGCPVLGEVRYGGADSYRLWLHAYSLSLIQPHNGEILECYSPMLEDFERGWKKLPMNL
jgi:23S rRNA pseudouridine1911/1915/1917 synthase